jgi:hypothetical protein
MMTETVSVRNLAESALVPDLKLGSHGCRGDSISFGNETACHGGAKMVSKLGRFWILYSMAGILLAGCTSDTASTAGSPSAVMAAREQLQTNLHQCTATYGYNPNQVSGIAEHALAPHELQWRQCAYDAIRTYTIANPALMSNYDQLVAEDISMTTAIQQGTMTRSQRHARIEELLGQIREAEDREIDTYDTMREEQHQQLRNVVENMRGFAR